MDEMVIGRTTYKSDGSCQCWVGPQSHCTGETSAQSPVTFHHIDDRGEGILCYWQGIIF